MLHIWCIRRPFPTALFVAYFARLPQLEGYLVEAGTPHLGRLAQVLQPLAEAEGPRLAEKSRRWRRWTNTGQSVLPRPLPSFEREFYWFKLGFAADALQA